MNKLGYMQGRLSNMIDGKIQAFPANTWREEMILGAKHNIYNIEWTLDHFDIKENPFLTQAGQNEIKAISKNCGAQILSVTGDCFMQAPIWKLDSSYEADLTYEFLSIIDACQKLDVGIVVIPSVDFSSLQTLQEGERFINFCNTHYEAIKNAGVRIAIESDFGAQKLDQFIRKLPNDVFGVNYDIGNSASLGFSHKEEIATYGDIIFNVHVKDRAYGGITVPLGDGNSNFPEVFQALFAVNYPGNFILQTARAKEDNHLDVLLTYKDFTEACIKKYFI